MTNANVMALNLQAVPAKGEGKSLVKGAADGSSKGIFDAALGRLQQEARRDFTSAGKDDTPLDEDMRDGGSGREGAPQNPLTMVMALPLQQAAAEEVPAEAPAAVAEFTEEAPISGDLIETTQDIARDTSSQQASAEAAIPRQNLRTLLPQSDEAAVKNRDFLAMLSGDLTSGQRAEARRLQTAASGGLDRGAEVLPKADSIPFQTGNQAADIRQGRWSVAEPRDPLGMALRQAARSADASVGQEQALPETANTEIVSVQPAGQPGEPRGAVQQLLRPEAGAVRQAAYQEAGRPEAVPVDTGRNVQQETLRQESPGPELYTGRQNPGQPWAAAQEAVQSRWQAADSRTRLVVPEPAAAIPADAGQEAPPLEQVRPNAVRSGWQPVASQEPAVPETAASEPGAAWQEVRQSAEHRENNTAPVLQQAAVSTEKRVSEPLFPAQAARQAEQAPLAEPVTQQISVSRDAAVPEAASSQPAVTFRQEMSQADVGNQQAMRQTVAVADGVRPEVQQPQQPQLAAVAESSTGRNETLQSLLGDRIILETSDSQPLGAVQAQEGQGGTAFQQEPGGSNAYTGEAAAAAEAEEVAVPAQAAPAGHGAGAVQAGTFQQQLQEAAPAEAPAAPAQAQTDYEVPRQIVEQARLIRSSGNTEMVIHLKPEHLGDLTLKIAVTENGAVTASFHSDNAQVRTIIENSLVHLRQELSDQGLKVDSVEVFSGLPDGQLPQGQGQQAWQQGSQGRYHGDRNPEDYAEEADDLAAATLAQSQESAEEDGVDYRV